MRRVFLSFVEEDLNIVNMFRGQAKNRNSMLNFQIILFEFLSEVMKLNIFVEKYMKRLEMFLLQYV